MRSDTYFHALRHVLDEVEQTQQQAMDRAAEAIGAAFAMGGMLYAFGTGHSGLLAMELFYRAGGMVRLYPLFEDDLMLHVSASGSTEAERMEGVGRRLLCGTDCKAGDVVLVCSNSGRNCAPVELAIEAKARGATVIALTNLRHSHSAAARNPYGLRLFEVADIVLNNCGAIGDAALETERQGVRFAPTSTTVGAAILWEIVRRVVARMEALGLSPELFMSANLDGGDQFNAALIQKYKPLIPSL